MAISFRLRIMAIVLAVAVIPLGLVGLWLTRATARSGEELLRDRLSQSMEEQVAQVAARWTLGSSALLDLADSEPVRAALRDRAAAAVLVNRAGALALERVAARELDEWFGASDQLVHRLELRGIDGAALWMSGDRAPERQSGAAVALDVDVYDGPLGSRIGTLHALLVPSALFGPPTPRSAGVVVGAFDVRTGTSLLPLALDPALLSQERFTLAGEDWLVLRRTLTSPPLHLVAAAPLSPYTRPFESVARTGTLLLLAVAATGVMLALLLTGYLTRSLGRLAYAAEAVAGGDLEQRIAVDGRDEVSRVGSAFNTMTESLRSTMTELADRRALAAVGEFAASLAHEIRNPLTSVQLDMQMVEERLPADDVIARATQARALAEIRRLDGTVSGALRAARAGRMVEEPLDLREVIRVAAHAASPVVNQAGATLSLPSDDTASVAVRGDAGALEQVLLNLLLNAAQAVRSGGRIEISLGEENGEAVVSIRDDGPGIPEEDLARVFDPLFTTRKEGAGLGLAIARRLVEAHGGSIRLSSRAGEGTEARVALPIVAA